jgi:hypothetical protein
MTRRSRTHPAARQVRTYGKCPECGRTSVKVNSDGVVGWHDRLVSAGGGPCTASNSVAPVAGSTRTGNLT